MRRPVVAIASSRQGGAGKSHTRSGIAEGNEEVKRNSKTWWEGEWESYLREKRQSKRERGRKKRKKKTKVR